jgi:hypothetical protein
VRQRDRGFERIADRIGQHAAAGESAARLQFAGPKWCMNTSTPNSSHFAQNGWNFDGGKPD